MSKIYIDAGHGGKDGGASANGLVEKNLNLKVAKYLAEFLAKQGISTEMSRTTDTYVELSTRASRANLAKADYFVSIHHNAGGGHGADVIHSVVGGDGEELADKIIAEFKKIGQENHRADPTYFRTNSAGKDYYAVIRATKMPAVISEFAFLDSADKAIVDTDAELKAEAEALGRAILAQLGVTEKVISATKVDSTVKNLQTFLNSLRILGANGKVLAVDGIKGTNTTYALKKFQAMMGITQTGIFDVKTKTAITAIYTASSKLK